MEERQREALERFGLDPNQIIQKDGRYWMTAEQLGVALGYREPRKSMNNLLNRNRKEFEPFIAVIKLVTPGGMQEVTIYDTDGQRLAAMLARTPKSEKFRAFIVNMLKALERQEFVHISQVRNWQHAVVSQLEAWHDDLLDMQISKQLENSNDGPCKIPQDAPVPGDGAHPGRNRKASGCKSRQHPAR